MRGFYSPIDKLAADIPRTKGTGAEFMTELSKRPGYKTAEAEDRNLQTLMALPKMERAQFLQALKAKPAPSLEESKRVETPQDPDDARTKYEEYTLPGGENYREILLNMPHDPNRKQSPSSSHWGSPDVLAHVRAKDRTGPNGEKILHLEEIQSDWHQAGREKGYQSPDAKAARIKAQNAYEQARDALSSHRREMGVTHAYLASDAPMWQQPEAKARLKARRAEQNKVLMDLMTKTLRADTEYQNAQRAEKDTAPDAPFKKNWHELALKKMIHHAATNGYDSIAITPGAEQAKRYGLAKQIAKLHYNADINALRAFNHSGREVISEYMTPDKLPAFVGKDVAQSLLSTPQEFGVHTLEGQDLNVGGAGMKGFYDKMIPSFLNQFGKKYGAKVGTTGVGGSSNPTDEEARVHHGIGILHWRIKSPEEKEQLRQQAVSAPVNLHTFPITPEMREDVTKNGVPLYAEGGKVDVRPTVKDDTLQRKIPEIEEAAKALQTGIINRKDYDKVVNKHKPVKPYTFVPQPASDEDAERALMANKKPHWRGHQHWPAGRKVGLRLDIPAYETHGVWVNSIHDEEGKGEDKQKTSYGPVSSVKNATFDAGPAKGIKVATGEDNKSPFARIHGELHHMTEDEAVEHMKTNLNHPDYAQVGMDPRRHGFFYDRKSMKPVTHSAHVVQIGPLVLAHKPTYGKRETYARGGDVSRETIKPVGHGYTREQVTVAPNLDAMKYELMSVKHFVKKAK